MKTAAKIVMVLAGMAGLVANAVAENRGLSPIIGPVLADAGTGSTITVPASPKVKYDAAYSICKAMVPAGHRDFDLANGVGPSSLLLEYFMSRGDEFDLKTWKVTVVEGPKHGVIVPYPDEPISYIYRPENGYLGPDQITFVAEAQGKKFKVIETVWVADVAPEFGGCPADYKLPPADGGNNKGSALDILELPTDGPLDAEALAKLHAIISFSMGAGMPGSGSTLNFADLPGSAVGQTVGSNITLDTSAAGHGWYVDANPWDNSEYLATSTRYEWVAKE